MVQKHETRHLSSACSLLLRAGLLGLTQKCYQKSADVHALALGRNEFRDGNMDFRGGKYVEQCCEGCQKDGAGT